MTNNIIFPSSAGFFPAAGGGGGGGVMPPNIYEVSPDGSLAYTSIQAAIDQAVADGYNDALFNSAIVAIYPGIYYENVTCHNGIHLAGIYNGGFGQICGIWGGVTFAPEPAVNGLDSTTVRMTGLFIIGDGVPALSLVDAGDGDAGQIVIDGCSLSVFSTETNHAVIKQDLVDSKIQFGSVYCSAQAPGVAGYDLLAGSSYTLGTLFLQGSNITYGMYLAPNTSFEGTLDIQTSDTGNPALYIDDNVSCTLYHGSKLQHRNEDSGDVVWISDNSVLNTYGTYWFKESGSGGKLIVTDGTTSLWFFDAANAFINNDTYDLAIDASQVDNTPTGT